MYQRLPECPTDVEATGTNGRWDAAPDLERFLASFYRYFEVKGYRGVLAVHLSHLVALVFTIAFSFILLFFVNWQALLSCDSEDTCRAVYLCYTKPFHHIGVWRSMVLMSFCLFSIYWIFNVVVAFQNVRDAGEISTYYKERLGIVSDEILATMTWSEVIARLMEQQKSSPFCIVQDELTALEVANIIMREDNFMIAFTNHHTFTSRLPSWIPARLVHTRSVHWNLRAAVFNHIFDARSRIRADFLERPAALAQRLRWMGLMNLLLVVPVLIFVMIYIVMRHAEEFRSHRTSPFQRQWTDLARWTFREFNELPHQFKARMAKAQHMAEAYVSATRPPSPVREALQRCVKYIAGSFLAVLLLVALWDETPLLFVKIQEKNLLWYLAFFGFVFAIADGTEDTPVQQGGLLSTGSGSTGRRLHAPSTPLHMHCAIMRLVKCTHFLPPSWRAPVPLGAMVGSCGGGTQRAKLLYHFGQIRAELLHNFFVQRIQVLVEELVGVILTPLLLIHYLPQAAPDIVEIVRLTRHSSPNLGDWCSFGCLDPARSGNEFYGGPPPRKTEGPFELETGQASSEGTLISNGGKLEKSVVSFVLTHRLSWPIHGCNDIEDGGFQQTEGSQRRGNGYVPPLLKPSLGEEMRRSLHRFADASAESYQQFSASSSARAVGSSQRATPLLSKMSQSDIPLVEFTRVIPDANEASDGAQEWETRHHVSASWSGPKSSNSFSFTQLVPEAAQPTSPGGVIGPEGLYFQDEAFQSFSLATPAASEADEASADFALTESMIEDTAWKVWGYPSSALRLLYNLEEFQKKELSTTSPHQELYALLPEELLRAERATSALDGSPCSASPSGGWSEEADQGSCSSHFFWLEVLYDYHSGRHPSSQVGERGVSRAGAQATFERLDEDSSMPGRGPGPAGCELQ